MTGLENSSVKSNIDVSFSQTHKFPALFSIP